MGSRTLHTYLIPSGAHRQPGTTAEEGHSRDVCETEEVVQETQIPFPALIAHLYHGIDMTSCQDTRNVSALALVPGNLRA